MVHLMTPVQLPPAQFALQPESTVLSLGSCFAQHMATRLSQSLARDKVCANPFGVIYDAQSLAQTLSWLMTADELPSSFFFQDREGLWKSWLHAGEFAGTSYESCQSKTSQSLAQARLHLHNTQILLLTFSTSVYYQLHSECSYANPQLHSVSNCHKMPAFCFEQRNMSLPQLLTCWQPLLAQLHEAFPKLHILFTLSPFRYAKYGLTQSAVDKAKLRLLIDELCDGYDYCSYFPSYEILLDELRDYRFYDSDLLHPSALAIEYIWERFSQHYFSPQLQQYSKERLQLLKQLAHRPLHPESPAHRAFTAKLQSSISAFEQKYGHPL